MSSSAPSSQRSSGKRGLKRSAKTNDNDEKSSATTNNAQHQPGTSSTTSESAPYCVPLSVLNPYITCSLCNGYFVDAVTVMDCLHTFCKSCLIKYFEGKLGGLAIRLLSLDHNDCPSCHSLIHQSHPTHYVSFDRTLQEIVYKLVPGLQSEEYRRRTEFMEERSRLGLPNGGESESDEEDRRSSRRSKKPKTRGAAVQRNGGLRNGTCGAKAAVEKEQVNGGRLLLGGIHLQAFTDGSPATTEANGHQKPCCTESDASQAHHRRDEAALIHLVPADDSSGPIQRPFIRVSVFATINTLKRTLSCYLRCGDISHYNDYDIFCNDELMGRDYSILFIQKTRWRDHSPDEPIRLVYKIHKDF